MGQRVTFSQSQYAVQDLDDFIFSTCLCIVALTSRVWTRLEPGLWVSVPKGYFSALGVSTRQMVTCFFLFRRKYYLVVYRNLADLLKWDPVQTSARGFQDF